MLFSLPVSIIVLVAVLYYPVYRLILTVSVGRLQKKKNAILNEEEIKGQSRRAHFITIILLPLFSYIYNTHLMGGG